MHNQLIFNEIASNTEGVKYYKMTEYKNHIESNPEIMFGKPCIKGTRVPVDLILRKLAGGWTMADLLDAYPRITKEDVEACLLFAADSVQTEILVTI